MIAVTVEIVIAMIILVVVVVVTETVITKLTIKTSMKDHESSHRYCTYHPALPRRLEAMQGSCNLNASAECYWE